MPRAALRSGGTTTSMAPASRKISAGTVSGVRSLGIILARQLSKTNAATVSTMASSSTVDG